jgi:NADPH:quinone reductase-like Zn-dependent oxidoreductase
MKFTRVATLIIAAAPVCSAAFAGPVQQSAGSGGSTPSLAAATTSPRSVASVPATIRSVVLEKTAEGYRWNLTRKPMPTIGAHQVLVRVRAVSLNRGDLEILTPDPHMNLTGLQPGSDAAGDVIRVGREVTDVRPGEKVTSTYFRNWTDGPPSRANLEAALGASVPGVLADYVALDDTAVMPMPKGYSYAEAATLPTAGLTGWVATVGRNALGPGKVVLIEGTGGVSTFAMQFAAATGARIILTSSSDEKLQRMLKVANHDSINYRLVPNWSQRVMQLTGRRGADLIVDVGGKRTLLQALRSLAPGGTVSIVGGLTGYDGEISAGLLLENVARAQGVFVGSRADFRKMIDFIQAHRLHPLIDRVLPLGHYQEALQLMQADRFVGKIVLRLDE